MACTCPVDAWRPRDGAENRRLVFNPAKGLSDQYVRVPCGQCTACRLAKARSWAIRCVHESQMHEVSSFITPTFDDEHLPVDYSVSKRELQLFNKKLRHAFGPFRFFGCGEYGSKGLRPHYHELLFGLDFPDKVLYSVSGRGERLYYSEALENVWGKGRCLIGSVTLQSAGYCARYSMKKITGDRAAEHYRRVHPVTGEHVQVRPEFISMSRMPGIGASWFEKFKTDAFPSDFVTVKGRKLPVPDYYLRKLEDVEQAEVKAARRERGLLSARREAELHAESGYGQSRLLTKHQVQDLRASRLVRDFEGVDP